MFNNKDIQTLHKSVSNYIEILNTQKANLTIGNMDCSALIETYDNQINDSYIVQKKLNGLFLQETNLKK